MIAYHERPALRLPPWFERLRFVAVIMICGIGALIAAGIFAGQIEFSTIVFLVVFLGLGAYILTRQMTVYGVKFYVTDVFAGSPTGEPAGAPEIRQRLAACEAQILRLREANRDTNTQLR